MRILYPTDFVEELQGVILKEGVFIRPFKPSVIIGVFLPVEEFEKLPKLFEVKDITKTHFVKKFAAAAERNVILRVLFHRTPEGYYIPIELYDKLLSFVEFQEGPVKLGVQKEVG